MEDYINGCYTKYGTRPLNKLEIKHKSKLSNGMWCVIGYIPTPKDGVSADVYRDEELKELVFMEHGYKTNNTKMKTEQDFELIKMLLEIRLQEMNLV